MILLEPNSSYTVYIQQQKYFLFQFYYINTGTSTIKKAYHFFIFFTWFTLTHFHCTLFVIVKCVFIFLTADSTGTHSLYTTYQDYEIMFHVSTMLPYMPNNPQQVRCTHTYRCMLLHQRVCVERVLKRHDPTYPDRSRLPLLSQKYSQNVMHVVHMLSVFFALLICANVFVMGAVCGSLQRNIWKSRKVYGVHQGIFWRNARGHSFCMSTLQTVFWLNLVEWFGLALSLYVCLCQVLLLVKYSLMNE